MTVDGGLIVLAADKKQIIAGVGDPSVFTATVTSMGSRWWTRPSPSPPPSAACGPSRAAASARASWPPPTPGQAQAQLIAGSMDMGQAR